MSETFSLGRFAGVRVGLNWSVLVIFLLIVSSLATGRFPLVFPDQSPAAYWAAGLTAGILFFLSLLAHEVAHALVAMRNGIDVDGITLWLFGGVARLQGEARDPGADLRIAGVGPLVSLVLAGLFALVAYVVSLLGLGGLAREVAVWLAVINTILAIFNLMPAAPLDGGRVLRAILWRVRGDALSASITAARAGRVFGFVLVGIGLLQFAFLLGYGGLWTAFIGWFLIMAASAEEQQAKLRAELGDVRVRDVMSPDPTAVHGGETISDFIEEFALRHRHSAFPLVDETLRPVGLITLNRIKQVPREKRETTAVRDVACPMGDVPTADPDEPLVELLERMRGCSDGRALVVADERLVGIVSPTDVARTLQTADLRRDPARV